MLKRGNYLSSFDKGSLSCEPSSLISQRAPEPLRGTFLSAILSWDGSVTSEILNCWCGRTSERRIEDQGLRCSSLLKSYFAPNRPWSLIILAAGVPSDQFVTITQTRQGELRTLGLFEAALRSWLRDARVLEFSHTAHAAKSKR